jgi:uncharacterized protein DUF4255/carboxypeptidase family protein
LIDYLDTMLRQLCLDQIDSTLLVGFQAPDVAWRTSLPPDKNALNIYLADLRENRVLRTLDRYRTYVNGQVSEAPAPRRVDCHYLVSAWSPVKVTPTLDPTLDEHALLHQFATVMANADPLVAGAIFGSAGLPAGFPALLANYQVPVTLLPPDGFTKLGEFWNSMEEQQPWRPVIYMVLTVPLSLNLMNTGPMVTTLTATLLQTVAPGSTETLIEIGGTVSDSQVPPQPVSGAFVQLRSAAGASLQTMQSDTSGRFFFTGLTPGPYQLRGSSVGFPPTARAITVPSPSGEYDLQL